MRGSFSNGMSTGCDMTVAAGRLGARSAQPFEQPVWLARRSLAAPGDVGIRPHNQQSLGETVIGLGPIDIEQRQGNTRPRGRADQWRRIDGRIEADQGV